MSAEPLSLSLSALHAVVERGGKQRITLIKALLKSAVGMKKSRGKIQWKFFIFACILRERLRLIDAKPDVLIAAVPMCAPGRGRVVGVRLRLPDRSRDTPAPRSRESRLLASRSGRFRHVPRSSIELTIL